MLLVVCWAIYAIYVEVWGPDVTYPPALPFAAAFETLRGAAVALGECLNERMDDCSDADVERHIWAVVDEVMDFEVRFLDML